MQIVKSQSSRSSMTSWRATASNDVSLAVFTVTFLPFHPHHEISMFHIQTKSLNLSILVNTSCFTSCILSTT